MIIPLWVKIAVAAGLFALGTWSGWTVRDWKRDSEVLKGVETATKALDKSRAAVDKAAGAYEQENADATVVTNTRESTIREIYRNAPPTSVDCAAPDAAVSVLHDAVGAANARASGQPAPAVSADP